VSEWLDSLENSVKKATAEIARLRGENDRLSTVVAELEARLAAATNDGEDPAVQAWAAERDEVRRRVEALTERLEGLVGDLGEGP
jgi:ubiquinone biosynthesis protein UbiJ